MKKDIFDELIVVKRSGQRVNFNSYKIAIAIKGCFDNVSDTYSEEDVNSIYEKVLKNIEKNYEERKTINVEDIQDIIEKTLKSEKRYDEYEAFSNYRQKRAESRQVFKIKGQHKFAKAMVKIADDNLLKTDNNYSPNEILMRYGNTVANEYSRAYLIDNKYLRAHEEGNIFIHNIETFPLGKLSDTHLDLKEKIEKEESISSILYEVLKSKDEINGIVNIPAIDYLLEPWVLEKYKKIFSENATDYLKLCGFDCYINFKKLNDLIQKETDINLDIEKYSCLALSKKTKDIIQTAHETSIEKIRTIIYKKIKKIILSIETCDVVNPLFNSSFGTNESMIGKMINSAIIKNLEEIGTLNNLHFTYKINKIDEESCTVISNLLQSTEGLNISLIHASYNESSNEVEYFSNGVRIFENYNDERYSIGRMVVNSISINMTRIALESRNEEEYFKNLDNVLELVKNELLIIFEMLGNKNKDNYKILFNGNIKTDEKLLAGQKIRKVIKNGNLLIGLVGLKESILLHEKDREKGYKLLLKILNHIVEKCQNFTNETKINFSIYEPSDEEVRKIFMKLDKTIYGIKKGITEKCKYDLVLDEYKSDYDKCGEIQKHLSGGCLLNIVLNDTSISKIEKLLIELEKRDIGFVHIKGGANS